MAEHLPLPGKPVRLLDPGAGLGILACAVCETSTSDLEVAAFEVDDALKWLLEACLRYAQQWMAQRGRSLHYHIHQEDFVLAYADALYWPTTAPFDAVIENHLNYIYRPGGDLSSEETRGLAALLNSSLMDTYFRRFSGNTQVSATELRALPLPPLELIIALGELCARSDAPVDTFISEVLGLYA